MEKTREQLKAEIKEELLREELKKEVEKEIQESKKPKTKFQIAYEEAMKKEQEKISKMTPEEKEKYLRKNGIKNVIIFVIFISILLVGIAFIFNPSNKPTTNIASGSCDSEMKKAIANEYKSPSTVKFISCQWDKTKGIYGEADAQNGFGATVRTSFLCNGNSCLITEK